MTVCGGAPRPSWSAELALLALVDVLAGPLRPTARRVVGLWPESGSCRYLDVGREELEVAARAVTDLVGAVVGAAVGTVAGAEAGTTPANDERTTGFADEAAA